MDFDKAIALPVAAQIALGSGYLAYLIAYAGLRDKHTTADAVFRAAAFGLIATAFLTWLDGGRIGVQVAAVMWTIAAGAFWRWRGMTWSRELLRQTDISWTDDIPTAWLSITAIKTHPVSQIIVDTDDGRTLMCNDTRPFADAPHGPCVFGLSGDLALYVTSERPLDGDWIDHDDVFDPIDGPRLTYIPSSKIKRLELRHWTEPTAKAVEVATARAPDAVAEPEAG